MTDNPFDKIAVEAAAKTIFNAADKYSNGWTTQNTWDNVSPEVRNWATERANDALTTAVASMRERELAWNDVMRVTKTPVLIIRTVTVKDTP